MDWLNLAQDRYKLQAVFKMTINIQLTKNSHIFLTNWRATSFSRRTLPNGITASVSCANWSSGQTMGEEQLRCGAEGQSNRRTVTDETEQGTSDVFWLGNAKKEFVVKGLAAKKANSNCVFLRQIVSWTCSSDTNSRYMKLRQAVIQCPVVSLLNGWLLYVLKDSISNNSTFCPHSVLMCFVWIWEQTAIISLYSINWLVFITESVCVYCAVRTGS